MAVRNEMTGGGFGNPRPFLYEMNLGNIIPYRGKGKSFHRG